MSVPLGSAGGSAQIIFGPSSDFGILFSEFPFPLRAAGGSLRMTFGPTGPFVSLFWSSQIFNSNSRSIVLKTIYWYISNEIGKILLYWRLYFDLRGETLRERSKQRWPKTPWCFWPWCLWAMVCPGLNTGGLAFTTTSNVILWSFELILFSSLGEKGRFFNLHCPKDFKKITGRAQAQLSCYSSELRFGQWASFLLPADCIVIQAFFGWSSTKPNPHPTNRAWGVIKSFDQVFFIAAL